MNEIVSINNEIDYGKQLYPNNQELNVNIWSSYDYCSLKIGQNYEKLSLLEKMLNLNSLFIDSYEYNKIEQAFARSSSYPELVLFSKDNPIKNQFRIDSLLLVDSQGNTIKPNYIKKIEKVYYNKENFSLVIVIDEKFQSSEEKRQMKLIKEEKVRKEKEKEHLKKQQREISDRISKLLD
jgi:hypothetical protein